MDYNDYDMYSPHRPDENHNPRDRFFGCLAEILVLLFVLGIMLTAIILFDI